MTAQRIEFWSCDAEPCGEVSVADALGWFVSGNVHGCPGHARAMAARFEHGESG